MDKELIGMTSGGIVLLSVIPYLWRVYEGKIHPNITTWSLWTLIGLILLLTYNSSGAKESIWPAVFGFTNPFMVVVLSIWKKGEIGRLNKTEQLCVFVTSAALIMWFFMKDYRDVVQYALYVALVADVVATVPQMIFVWESPYRDRPFAWWIFGIGYGLAIFAISEHTIANYALPVFMTIVAFAITTPLVVYRLKKKIPLREWI